MSARVSAEVLDEADRVVTAGYTAHTGAKVTRAEFEAHLAARLSSGTFVEDIRLLVPVEVGYDPSKAVQIVKDELIARLPGEPWKGTAP